MARGRAGAADRIRVGVVGERGRGRSHIGSLAELAEENGSSGPELEAALVDAVDARLQEAVANGDITPQQAERMKCRLPLSRTVRGKLTSSGPKPSQPPL